MLSEAISPRRRLRNAALAAASTLAAALTALLAFFLVLYVFTKGLPEISWQLLTTKPSYLADTIGILPDILNTVYIEADA